MKCDHSQSARQRPVMQELAIVPREDTRPATSSSRRVFARWLIYQLFIQLITSSIWAGTATITIDAAKIGPRLNPRMYGIFLEEINFGVDGGLYAELIRNRGFEDAKPPEGYTFRNGHWLDEKGYDARFSRFGYVTNGLPSWSLVKEGNARGAIYLDMSKPLNTATPRSLRL